MAEIKRNTTPVPNKMTVIDKGDEMSRPSSSGSSSRKPLKKATSEGLISLAPEPPSQVKFEEPPRPSSGSSRCGSARRIEKKLQVLKKKVEPQLADFQNTSSSFETISKGKEPTVKVEALAKQPQNDSCSKKTVFEEKPNNKQETNPEESTDDSSDSDSDDSDSDEDKPTAPIEMKGEFIKHVMDEDYEKAKELCQKILLLEPNNSVCIEFHGLILQKLEQEKQAEEESDDEDDDDDEDDEEEDDDDSGDSDDESDESESDSDDDDYTPPPGLNLIMGGLPIKPQPN